MLDSSGSRASRAGGRGTFSLGMRQRLGVAAALLGDPPILILDEPTIGLDPEGIQWMRETLRALAAEGRTVFVSSHLMSELEDTADQLIVIGKGRLLADVSVDELIATASGDRVEIKTPDATTAMTVLANTGATVISNGRERVAVQGMPAAQVAEVLVSHQVRLEELVSSRVTLEEAYFQLTRGAGEHTSVAIAPEGSTHDRDPARGVDEAPHPTWNARRAADDVPAHGRHDGVLRLADRDGRGVRR